MDTLKVNMVGIYTWMTRILNKEVDKQAFLRIAVPALLLSISSLVMLGHFIGNEYLTSFGEPERAGCMKLGTAMAFWFIALTMFDYRMYIIMFAVILFQIVRPIVFLISGFTSINRFGLDMFSFHPAAMSMGTVMCLLLTLVYLKTSDFISRALLKGIGLIVLIGGYILNTDLLKFYIEGVSSAMAIHTAILFLIITLWTRQDV